MGANSQKRLEGNRGKRWGRETLTLNLLNLIPAEKTIIKKGEGLSTEKRHLVIRIVSEQSREDGRWASQSPEFQRKKGLNRNNGRAQRQKHAPTSEDLFWEENKEADPPYLKRKSGRAEGRAQKSQFLPAT